jgi:biopolymer transport protein TolQ
MPIHLPILGLLAQAQGGKGLGVWELFLDAGPVDKFILAVLAFFSLVSWGIILSKGIQFRRADKQTRRFLEIFRTSKRFSEVNAAASNHSASPLVGLFQSGYVEIDAQVKAAQGEGADPSRYRIRSMAAIERTLRRAVGVELHVLTRSTQFLATTAAAAPFIGLFGTVWGIMQAFNDIGITVGRLQHILHARAPHAGGNGRLRFGVHESDRAQLHLRNMLTSMFLRSITLAPRTAHP